MGISCGDNQKRTCMVGPFPTQQVRFFLVRMYYGMTVHQEGWAIPLHGRKFFWPCTAETIPAQVQALDNRHKLRRIWSKCQLIHGSSLLGPPMLPASWRRFREGIKNGGLDFSKPPLIVWRVKRTAVRRLFSFAVVRQFVGYDDFP